MPCFYSEILKFDPPNSIVLRKQKKRSQLNLDQSLAKMSLVTYIRPIVEEDKNCHHLLNCTFPKNHKLYILKFPSSL